MSDPVHSSDACGPLALSVVFPDEDRGMVAMGENLLGGG